METPVIYLSRDIGLDYLSALPLGCVLDGQPQECWEPLSEAFAFYRRADGEPIVGFHVRDELEFDVEDPALEEIWTSPRFAAPILGLAEAPAGEIIVAARAHFGERDSLNRFYFNQAVGLQGEEALRMWLCCLESGDSMAHFAIGYTLYELGDFRHAYRHLRHYAEIAPNAAWNWCWLGKAAIALGELDEARRAYERAIDLTEAGDDPTDAPEDLAALTDRAAVR